MPRLSKDQREGRLEQLRAEANLLRALADNPAWQIVTAEVAKENDRLTRELARAGALDIREFDYKRGRLAGALWVLSIPTKAQATFEQATKTVKLIDGGSD